MLKKKSGYSKNCFRPFTYKSRINDETLLQNSNGDIERRSAEMLFKNPEELLYHRFVGNLLNFA